MLDLLFTVIKLVIMLGIVATVHEFGHFLFAKLFRMTVKEFSIGFGKKMWQKEYKGTLYSLRLILMGGYVAIEGEEKESEDPNSFNKKPAWQRIIVLVAGVLFNAILAIVLLLSVCVTQETPTTTIVSLEEDSPLIDAGIQVGDTITKMGNTVTHVYDDIYFYNKTDANDIEIEYIRNGQKYTTIAKDVVKRTGYMGVYFDANYLNEDGTLSGIVLMTEPGSASSEAGLKAGDKIIAVNGISTQNTNQIVNIISINAGKEVTLTIERDNEKTDVIIEPKEKLTINFGILGVEIKDTTLIDAWHVSINVVRRVVGSYVDLFKGKVKVNQMSGIVGIGEVISTKETFAELVLLLATISLAVGIANILPFLPLDGGKVVLVLWEVVTRKKVSEKVELVLSYIGLGLLLALTIYITIKDIIRII